MSLGALKRRTFLFYLAACNFIVFNFGFHVHEKAILMTVIPLALEVHSGSSNWTKLRFLLIKTIALWTLLPLLILPGENLTKHAIQVIDYFLTTRVWLQIKVESSAHKALLNFVLGSIVIVELWKNIHVDMITGQDLVMAYTYRCIIPIISTIINQGLFLEMMYKCIIRPDTIEGSWTKDQKKIKTQ